MQKYGLEGTLQKRGGDAKVGSITYTDNFYDVDVSEVGQFQH
jgi:uncharacterized protein YkvS